MLNLLLSILLLMPIGLSAESICPITERTFGGKFFDSPSEIISTVGNGLAVVGTSSSLSYDGNRQGIWFLRMDSAGDTLFTRYFGGEMRDLLPAKDEGKTTIQMQDKGFAIAGFYKTEASIPQLWIIRISENGQMLWSKVLPDKPVPNEPIFLQCTMDNKILIVFTVYRGSNVRDDIEAIILDSIGTVIHSEFFGITTTIPSITYGYSQDARNLYKIGDTRFRILASHFPDNSSPSILWIFDVDTSLTATNSRFCEARCSDFVVRTIDNGYLMKLSIAENEPFGGISTSGPRTIIQKADSLGYVSWFKSYEQASSLYNTRTIAEMRDSSIILTSSIIFHMSSKGGSLLLFSPDYNSSYSIISILPFCGLSFFVGSRVFDALANS